MNFPNTGINKTKAQIATERVEEFLAEVRTEIVVQVAQATADVTRATATATVAKANSGLKKANDIFEIARYATPSSGDLEGYVLSRENALAGIDAAKAAVSHSTDILDAAKEVVVRYEAVAEDLA